MRTIFPKENGGSCVSDTTPTQKTAEIDGANVKYPKRIKYRGSVFATIYNKTKARPTYRVAWKVAGRRRMASFPSYSRAKDHADRLVRDLARGSQVTALNPTQARDALAAIERLADNYRTTGRRVSLLAAVSEYVEASSKLNGRSLNEAVDGFLRNVAIVQRKDIAAALAEFIQTHEVRTKTNNGGRAQLSGKYFYNRQIQLWKFARAFPNNVIGPP